MKEEIDFYSLNKFISKNIFNQIKDELFLKENNYKSFSNSYFLKSCLNVAGANTPEKNRIVCSYVKDVLKFLKDFYYDEYDKKRKVLVSICVDNISKNINKRIKDIEINFERLNTNLIYKDSFASVIDDILPNPVNKSPFHYRNDIITFRGREEEQKEIYNFLDDERKLLWMAITGDGGSGKSKLMYHMTQRLESNDCWKVIWLGKESLKSIMTKDKFEYPINLLFVCDYGGQFAEKLGNFIEKLCVFGNTYNEKIRLVILEREEVVQEEDKIIEPVWYKSFRGDLSRNHYIDSAAYGKNNSMKLKTMDDKDFRLIVKDYLTEKKKSLSDEEINIVIKKAHEMDNRETGTRPLILLFIADAVADGKEAKNWDLNKLVEHFIERYKYYWKLIIGEKNDDLFKAVEEITAYATAVGGWDLRNKKIGEPIKSSIDLFLRKVDDKNMFLHSMCEKDKSDGIWSPFEPDLIGEFFVLDFLREKIQNYDDEYVSNFSDICWENGNIFFAHFLLRAFQNYNMQKRFNTIFDDIIKLFEPKDKNNKLFYLYLIWDLSITKPYFNLNLLEKALDKFRVYSNIFKENQEIQLLYAQTLVNLTSQQEMPEIKKTIDELKSCVDKYPNNEKLLSVYTTGLFNLTIKENLPGIYGTIKELEKISIKNPQNKEIQLSYAKGLYNLIIKSKYLLKNIYELKLLVNDNSDNDEIQLLYSEIINILFSRSKGILKRVALTELKFMADKSSHNTDNNQVILIKYLNNLFVSQFEQNMVIRKLIIEEINKYYIKYNNNFNIQNIYFMSITAFVLRLVELDKESIIAINNIKLVESIAHKHKDNEELQKIYNQFLDELNKLLS